MLGQKIATSGGDLVLVVPTGSMVRYRAGPNEAAREVATVDALLEVSAEVSTLSSTQVVVVESMTTAQADMVANLTAQLRLESLRSQRLQSELSAQVSRALHGIQEQVTYLYNITRTEAPTQQPSLSPLSSPPSSSPTIIITSCDELPAGSPSGIYNVNAASGITRVYCMTNVSGKNWNLCGKAGGTRVRGGSQHWYGNFGNRGIVNFEQAQAGTPQPPGEATWCGLISGFQWLLVVQVSSDGSWDSAIKVKWYNRPPNNPVRSRNWPINRDVSYVNNNRAGYLNTDQRWSNSNNAFTEHFYLTFASRGRDPPNYNPRTIQYYEIGGHNDGAHQHYEEQCCGGGGQGDGTIGAGTYYSSAGGCGRFTCDPSRHSKHVYFFYSNDE